jgi:hypothetical protein
MPSLFDPPVLDKSVAQPSQPGYHKASTVQHPFEPLPEQPSPEPVPPKKDFLRALVVLVGALVLGTVLAGFLIWRPGQDVQPKAQTAIIYEPLEKIGGATEQSGGGKYHRVLDRIRSWKARRK